MTLRVALVTMPWARVDAPSIQCGLLKSLAVAAGHRCEVLYPNLDLAALLGGSLYDAVADLPSERLHMLGEWLFSHAAFGPLRGEDAYFAEYPELAGLWHELTGEDLGHLVSLRREVLPGWLGKLLGDIAWDTYDVIGFSSTFLQNTASLALGRLIRDRFPGPRLVYGGANFDGEMGEEYSRRLPWLDYVVSGEADTTFPALLAAIANGERGTGLPGVHVRDAVSLPLAGPAATAVPVRNLDSLPVPDYHEYFEALDRYDRRTVLGGKPVTLPVELSRGCWWGQKHHCTFCGLNSAGMAYRAKTAGRAMTELSALLRDYPAVHVDAVDNILDMSYLSSLCVRLGEQHWDVNLFFEVKANLNRAQLSTMRRAGIHRVQPGIESLSTHVLGLMRKGATVLTNVRFMKWARYYDIFVLWNMLMGVPGENDEDYRTQAELIPLLHHLQPPSGSAGIWLERFSPYFTDPSFPISGVRPNANYRHVYPETLDHAKIAYFFDYEAAGVSSAAARSALGEAIGEWRRRWRSPRRPQLVYQRLPGLLRVVDQRGDQVKVAELPGWRAAAYEAAGDAPRSAAGVRRTLLELGDDVAEASVRAFLDSCCRAGIMLADDGHYLAIALPENPDW